MKNETNETNETNEIDSLVGWGLRIAATGRRDQDELEEYRKEAYLSEHKDIRVRFKDEEGDSWTSYLSEIPFFGNKSARLVYDWEITSK